MQLDPTETRVERKMISGLKKHYIVSLLQLYSIYHEDLLIFIYAKLQDRKLAIDMVDDFFADLWNGAWRLRLRPPLYKQLVQRITKICEAKYPLKSDNSHIKI